MSLVIGLVGEKGSGKETFGNFLEEIVKDRSIYRFRFSDILLQTLQLWSITPNRENLQKLAVVMKDGFGPDTLSRAAEKLMKEAEADIFVIDGLRWITDLELLRSFPSSILVYITADVKKRFQRLKKRDLSYRKETQSMEKFLKEERAENEIYIPAIAKEADVVIDNNGTFEDLKNQVKVFTEKLPS